MSRPTTANTVDSTANKYALRCFCITMAAFMFAWVLNQADIFIVEKRTMTLALGMSAGLFLLCLGICALFGLNSRGMKYVLLLFIIGITTVIEVMLTYHSVLLSAIPIVYASMYQDTKKMVLYTYLLSIVSIIVIVFGGYYVGLCDANMALLTSRPLAEYIAPDGTFSLTQLNPNPLLTLSLYFVFPRVVLCGVFVPICINISQIIADSRDKEEKMRMLAEIDGMTGLYNRSKYLDLVAHPYSTEESIAVIFWDINGLKRINDTLGHEYGDQLIVVISESIKAVSSPSERAYRIGGDEFVMIMRGGTEKTAQQKIQQWLESISGKTIGDDLPVSAAFGYAYGSGAQLEDIISRADEMMYRNKREYYINESALSG